ncbi:hypothetical protein L7F22_005011 [Adiantum nelumboides]|nr:hypothetical protein [Adiantum nelumboides]
MELRLDDPALYSDISAGELMRSYLNLQLLAFDPVVSMASRALSPKTSILLRGPMLWAVRYVTFPYFCAGENLTDASHTLSHLWHHLRLQGILNFALEDAFDETFCDSSLLSFLDAIRQINKLPTGSVSFACIKITAICPVPLLERVSNLLRFQHIHPSFNLPWQEKDLPVFAHESPMYCLQNQPEPLSPEEEKIFAKAKERLWQLCKESRNVGVPLLVDAEYASVQPAIDYLTYAAAVAFNDHSEGGTVVYGTMQAYLKDSFPREQALAAFLKIPSPVHKCIEDTHKCYNSSAVFLLEKAAAGWGRVVLATHNVESGRIAAAKALELGLTNRDSRLQFGQLKGMADSLSLSLVRAGFKVSKYLAYGPLEHLVPYLLRRAEENKGVVNNTAVDRRCIR